MPTSPTPPPRRSRLDRLLYALAVIAIWAMAIYGLTIRS